MQCFPIKFCYNDCFSFTLKFTNKVIQKFHIHFLWTRKDAEAYSKITCLKPPWLIINRTKTFDFGSYILTYVS